MRVVLPEASISVVSEPRAVATGSDAQLSINTYFVSYCLIRSLPLAVLTRFAATLTFNYTLMKSTDKRIDPLPDSFETEEQAGEFWDTHSLMDYQEHLEATDDSIEIRERVFEVQVAEDVFKKLQQEAASLHQPVPKIVDKILRKELA